jgi:divalent metal cation (Fe/Co/Zn/Cd) transporter
MVVEAVVSVEAGVYAGSVLLIAFGADSLIELISALVLLWRLRRESRALHGDEARVIRIERKAASIAGVLLYLLALFVTIEAVVSLFHRHAAQSSGAGLVVAMLAAVGMPLLANAKLRVADQIGSRALRADAAESITCGYLAWVLLAGLVANRALHLWWLDSVAALILVPFLLREGREAIQGKSCGACRTQPADEDPPRDHKPDAPAREV